jgi:hypothetical protein
VILYTWVGEDGLVRWSDELPDNAMCVGTAAAGVVANIDGTCTTLLPRLAPHGPAPVVEVTGLDMALVIAFTAWDIN